MLREIGYAGPIALELEVTDPENLPRYVQEAHTYMSELLALLCAETRLAGAR